MSIYVTGAGMTRFTRQPGKSSEELGAAAVSAALADADLQPGQAGALFCGSVFGGVGIGQRIARELGISRLPVVNLENACASSGVALRNAIAWVASGAVQNALVVGVEQLTARGSGLVKSDSQGPSEQLGLTLPGLYAMRAHRYLAQWGGGIDDLALVAVKNRANGAMNPDAHFREEVTLEQVVSSPMISTPLTRLQCCPSVDGAAALVISSSRGPAAARSVSVPAGRWFPATTSMWSGANPKRRRLQQISPMTWRGSGPRTSTSRSCTSPSRSPKSSTARASALPRREKRCTAFGQAGSRSAATSP
jgi:acetyl-CoA acetyltransferase